MNTEMICQSCTLIYHKDINMNIKKKLQETECANNLLMSRMNDIRDNVDSQIEKIRELEEKRCEMNERCCNEVFDELLETTKDATVKEFIKVLKYMSKAERLRKRCLNNAIDSNITNIEVGSKVTDIPYFDMFDMGNNRKVYINKKLFNLLSITTQNDIVTEIELKYL